MGLLYTEDISLGGRGFLPHKGRFAGCFQASGIQRDYFKPHVSKAGRSLEVVAALSSLVGISCRRREGHEHCEGLGAGTWCEEEAVVDV